LNLLVKSNTQKLNPTVTVFINCKFFCVSGSDNQGFWKDQGSHSDNEDMKPGLNGLGLMNGAPGLGVNPLLQGLQGLQGPLIGLNGLSQEAGFPFGGGECYEITCTCY